MPTSEVRIVGLHRLRKSIRERPVLSALTHPQRTAIFVGEALVTAGLSAEELTCLVGVLDAEVQSRGLTDEHG